MADAGTPAGQPARVTTDRTFGLVLLAVTIAACWIPPLRQSLWLDETGTYWIVKDGLVPAFERAWYFTNLSPYYALAWLAAAVGGPNEIILRLPSAAAMGAAAAVVFRIGARLFDRETGLLAAVIFVGLHDMAFAAADARPYAFTILALTAHVLALLRWLDTGRAADAAAATVLAALTAYGHVVLALGLVAPAGYAFWRTRRRGALVTMWAASALLAVPLVFQLRAYLGMDTVHSFGERPDLGALWTALAPPQLVVTLGAGILAAWAAVPGLGARWRPARPAMLMLAAWIGCGVTVLFAVSRGTEVQLFHPRYLMFTAPAAALIGGAVLRMVHPIQARRIALAVVVGLAAVSYVRSSKMNHGEDWRAAMAAVRTEAAPANLAVVTPSCFIEAQRSADLTDARLSEALFAPETVYPPAGRPVRLPYVLDEAYAVSIVERELAGEAEFLLLACGETETGVWLVREMTGRGYRTESAGDFRGLELRRFRKVAGGSRP